MSSKKNIGKQIADWFQDNTWIYSTVVTIVLALILAIVSINVGLTTSGDNNFFNGGMDWEWSIEEDDDDDSDSNKEEDSSVLNSSSVVVCEEHDWVYVGTKEPTCIDAGMHNYKCSVCSKTKMTSIRPKGHDFVDGSCTRCGARG